MSSQRIKSQIFFTAFAVLALSAVAQAADSPDTDKTPNREPANARTSAINNSRNVNADDTALNGADPAQSDDVTPVKTNAMDREVGRMRN